VRFDRGGPGDYRGSGGSGDRCGNWGEPYRGGGGHRGAGRHEVVPAFRRKEDDPPGTSRLFVAVPVADEIREAVGRLMEEVAGGPIDTRAYGQPRWVSVDGLHITLRFLGATPDDRQPDLARAMERATAGIAPFEISLSGAGAFPHAERPRVLWIGIVEGAGALQDLADRVAGELEPLGWPREDKPFAAHLTLARTDGVPGAAERGARLAEVAADVQLRWQADRVIVYKSLLGHGPAHYQAVAESRLAER